MSNCQEYNQSKLISRDLLIKRLEVAICNILSPITDHSYIEDKLVLCIVCTGMMSSMEVQSMVA